MSKLVLSVQRLSIISVIFTLISAVVMLVLGAVKVVKGVLIYFTDYDVGVPQYAAIARVDLTMKYFVQSIDAFLISLVLMLFAFGVYNLFVQRMPEFAGNGGLGSTVRSIGRLKNTLAELIIIILFVKFLEQVLLDIRNLSYDALVLPGAICLLAIALKLLDLRHDDPLGASDEGTGEPDARGDGEIKS
jgi:uncharacterized membrane protein YqhA